MRQDMDLNPSIASGPRFMQTRRQQLMNHSVAASAPGAIGGIEAWRTEGASRRGIARWFDCICCRRPVVQRATRVAEPPEFFSDSRPQRRAGKFAGYAAMERVAFQRGDRKGQSNGPALKALEQPTMAIEEAAKLSGRGIRHDVHEDHVIPGTQSNRELLRKVTNRPRGALIEHQRWEIVLDHRSSPDEVGDLFPFGPQPGKLRPGEDNVEHHQSFESARECGWTPMPVVWLSYGAVQTLVMDVVDPPGAAPARVRRGESLLSQLAEKVARVLPEHDVRERRVLPSHKDTRVHHDGR